MYWNIIGKVLLSDCLIYYKVLLTPYYKVLLHTAKQHSIIQSTAKFYAVLQSPNPFDSRKTWNTQYNARSNRSTSPVYLGADRTGATIARIFLLQGNPSKCNWRQRISCTFPLQDRLRHFKALKARTVSIMWYCKSSVSKFFGLGTLGLSMNFNGILLSPKWHFALSRIAWNVWCLLQNRHQAFSKPP